jgi:organic radical activating enzyme
MFDPDTNWKENNTLLKTNLDTWHTSNEIVQINTMMHNDSWANECNFCEKVENLNRSDSIRLNAENSYSHYSSDDIFLEIRPGNVCNYACQTCWPEASSRVSGFQAKAFNKTEIISKPYTDFAFLDSIKHRLKDVMVLGGEPFYDKNCLKFLDWMQENQLDANLFVFTNCSTVPHKFISEYKGKLTLIASLDAIGNVANYIRYGTVWDEVHKNYQELLSIDNINLRVNVTTSVYNLPYVAELIDYLLPKWPEIVSFGIPKDDYLNIPAIPYHLRSEIIDSLTRVMVNVSDSNMVTHQKQNTDNVLKQLVYSLKERNYNKTTHKKLISYCTALDKVKNTFASDYDVYYQQLLMEP